MVCVRVIVHTGQGKTSLAAQEFRIGGGFAFVTGLVRAFFGFSRPTMEWLTGSI